METPIDANARIMLTALQTIGKLTSFIRVQADKAVHIDNPTVSEYVSRIHAVGMWPQTLETHGRTRN
jgi:hypothetical protein